MKYVCMVALALLAVVGSASAANLLSNGDFSDPSNWVASEYWEAGFEANDTWHYGYFDGLDGWALTDVGGTDGTYAQNLREPQGAGDDRVLIQGIDRPAAGVYDLSFDYIMQDNDGMLWLDIYGLNDGQLIQLLYTGGSPSVAMTYLDVSISDAFGWGGPEPSPDWRQFSGEVTVADTDPDYLVFVVWGSGTVTDPGVEPLRGVDNVLLGTEDTAVPGDADGDGVVDLTDLGILATNWGRTDVTVGAAEGDFDDSGAVDLSDLGILATNWGTGTEAVPEPATMSLLGLGGLALLKRTRKS